MTTNAIMSTLAVMPRPTPMRSCVTRNSSTGIAKLLRNVVPTTPKNTAKATVAAMSWARIPSM